MRAQPWAAAFEGRGYYWRPTQDDAVTHAKDQTCLVAHPPTYKGYVAAMKAAAPALCLTTYNNLVLIDCTESGTSALPETAWTKNEAGEYMTGSDATYARLLNPLSPEATQYKINSVIGRMRSSGYPDLYLDVASATAPFGPYMGGNVSKPVDPRTGVAWTVNDWADAAGTLQTKIRAAVEKALGRPVKLVINSLSNGPGYWSANMQTLRPGVHAAVCEGWLRPAAAAATWYPRETVWKQCVDMIIDAETKGFKVLAMTKLWVSATAAQQQQLADYAAFTFLLASNGTSHLELSYYKGDSLIVKTNQKVELGDPAGAYKRETSGVYSREFVRGKVFVNPTAGTLTHSGIGIPAFTGKVVL